MAAIGSIHLGGKTAEGTLFRSGVCFFLDQESRYSKKLDFSKEIWEVEVAKDQKSIVARCKNRLSEEQVLVEGHKFAQMFLDLLSVYNNDTLFIPKASDSNIVFYEKDNIFILRDRAIDQFSVNISVEVIVENSKGEIVKPLKENFNWSQSLRFYRLSQLSSDLYDAYRNLFLALESLLSLIAPKRRDEGEVEWLRRVLLLIENQIDISSCVPHGSNLTVTNYFITKQYKDIRCKLFHSKGMNVLPHDSVNPMVVNNAYSNLIDWWRKISSFYLGIPENGGGITAHAFKMMMDNAFGSGFQFKISDDYSPYDPDHVTVSPLNKTVINFLENKYKCYENKGEIELKGSLNLKEEHLLTKLYRICTTIDGNLTTTQYYEDGIDLKEVSKIEAVHVIRHVNKNMPKVSF